VAPCHDKSSLIPFLALRRNVWLKPTAQVPCSNAANIGKRKTWMQSEFCTWQKSLRGKSPGKCVYGVPAQETVKGQTSCKGWLTSVERRWCSDDANMRNLLKFAGVSQTGKPILAVNRLKYTIL